MQLVRDPDPETALQFLQEELKGFERGRCILMVARCRVSYQGRARSMLHAGDRILMLKPDGTFLVHTNQKAKPVNWQPPGCTFHVELVDGALELTAYRPKPEELVKVNFIDISFLSATPIHDDESLDLVGSEADLQELLFARPSLVEPGFVPRRRERDSNRGYYDLDGDDAEGRRVVIEVKRGTAGVKDAQQLWRYVQEMRENRPDIRGMLMAPRIAPKARTLLSDHQLEWKELDWDELLPKVEAMRRGGQRGLEAFVPGNP